jgi:energy-coupling factor transporter ATP-binding protein EcfA2
MRPDVIPIHPEALAVLDGHPRAFSIDEIPSIWALEGRMEWLIDGLIPHGAVTLITGDSGVGKSTFALSMAGAVAHGHPFLERETMQKFSLYVDGENPVGVCRERLDRLGIAETDSLKVWGGWVDPAPEGPHAVSVIEWARIHRGLIVYDSLIQFHPGSEQDSSETRKYMKHYRHLAHQGAAVVVLANTGKGENTKQFRGSSDIKAAVDQAYCIEAVGDSGDSVRVLRLTPFKCRIADVKPLRVEFTSSGFRPSEDRVKTNREIVEQIIAAKPNSSGKEIISLATAAGVAKNRAEALLMEGVRDEWLIVTPAKHNTKLYRVRGPDD